MIDREKVIKALECCSNDKPFYHAHCDECPYNGRNPDNMGGCIKLYRDAMELLKEQEPVKPIERLGGTNWVFYECECNKPLYERGFNYCPWCGRSVKWDE